MQQGQAEKTTTQCLEERHLHIVNNISAAFQTTRDALFARSAERKDNLVTASAII